MAPDVNGDSDYRTITVKTVTGETIQGKVNILSKERVSDLFTHSTDKFLVMIDAVAKEVDDKTLFINKDHIVWVEPED